MNVKRALAAIALTALVAGLVPGMALAADDADASAAPLQMSTQKAEKNIEDCKVMFTDKQHSSADDETWQMYYVKGRDVAAKPAFDLYDGDTKVDPSAYTVSYVLTWWTHDGEQSKPVKASQLTPSASPEASETNMSSEFRVVVEAKKGSGYIGKIDRDDFSICVTDWYNVGRNMDVELTKAKHAWHYAINGMNRNYYVIPQAKVKATLNSVKVIAGAAGEGKAETLASKYYKATYYKARLDTVDENLDLVNEAPVGSALTSMPTTAGAYVMILEGVKPYYGKQGVLFDVQDDLSNVSIAKVADQKYTGKAIKPKLNVTYNGTKLVEGVDYKVKYANNKKKGTAKATITGCNKVLTFEFNPKTGPALVTKNKQRFFAGSASVEFNIV